MGIPPGVPGVALPGVPAVGPPGVAAVGGADPVPGPDGGGDDGAVPDVDGGIVPGVGRESVNGPALNDELDGIGPLVEVPEVGELVLTPDAPPGELGVVDPLDGPKPLAPEAADVPLEEEPLLDTAPPEKP